MAEYVKGYNENPDEAPDPMAGAPTWEGILDTLKTGMQSTLGAAQEDIGSMTEGKVPRNFLGLLNQGLMAYQNPMMGMKTPNVPTFTNPFFDQQKKLLDLARTQGRAPGEIQQLGETLSGGMSPENIARSVPIPGRFATPTQTMTQTAENLQPGIQNVVNMLLKLFLPVSWQR